MTKVDMIDRMRAGDRHKKEKKAVG
jgi:hypothetical protein